MKNLTDNIISVLKKRLDSSRFKHTLGTCRIAKELAAKNGVPEHKAVLAALLHDAGKGFNKNGMIKYASRHKLKVPEKKLIIKHNPSLLHSFISADIAKREFRVTDPDILTAIALHTLGGRNMSMLSKIIYISDSVSFDRRYPGVKQLRRLAYSDINAAVREAMANKIYYVIKKKFWLHPAAAEAWNSILEA